MGKTQDYEAAKESNRRAADDAQTEAVRSYQVALGLQGEQRTAALEVAAMRAREARGLRRAMPDIAATEAIREMLVLALPTDESSAWTRGKVEKLLCEDASSLLQSLLTDGTVKCCEKSGENCYYRAV